MYVVDILKTNFIHLFSPESPDFIEFQPPASRKTLNFTP